ncbi:hypothetical protein TNCV_4679131 [Trichonephila clavipes]|nr:hypothetical protein TNCV_4679131 [Trichonephila clavipes]
MAIVLDEARVRGSRRSRGGPRRTHALRSQLPAREILAGRLFQKNVPSAHQVDRVHFFNPAKSGIERPWAVILKIGHRDIISDNV